MKSVGIVGFGYIGAVIGTTLADRGCSVVGIETNADVVRLVNAGKTEIFEPGLPELLAANVKAGRLRASSDFAELAKVDYIIVTVGTPLGADLKADLSHIKKAAESIAQHLRTGHTVILKSTVVPNVTGGYFAKVLAERSGLVAGRDFFIAFSPERLAEGKAIQEFASLPIVVGADDPESSTRICKFWHEVLGVDVIKLTSTVSAELVKLADNVWIDMNIALANQIAKVCYSFGADFDEVQRAANSLPKGQHHVNILQSSVGVGGSCLTKDPLFFAHLCEEAGESSDFIRRGRAVNDGMPIYTVDVIDQWFRSSSIKRGKVAVLGASFKNDTNDLRYTPVLPLVRELTKRGHDFVLNDPYVSPELAKDVFTDVTRFVDLEEAVQDAHVLCFACGHKPYRTVDLSWLHARVSRPCLFLDGRHSFPRDAVTKAGFSYQTI